MRRGAGGQVFYYPLSIQEIRGTLAIQPLWMTTPRMKEKSRKRQEITSFFWSLARLKVLWKCKLLTRTQIEWRSHTIFSWMEGRFSFLSKHKYSRLLLFWKKTPSYSCSPTIESIANRSFASLWYEMSLFLRKHGAHKITPMPTASLGF